MFYIFTMVIMHTLINTLLTIYLIFEIRGGDSRKKAYEEEHYDQIINIYKCCAVRDLIYYKYLQFKKKLRKEKH